MNPFSKPDATGRMRIYLDDHRAMVAAELAATHRCRSSNEGSELAHDLTGHIGEVSRDRDLIDEMITGLDARPVRLKTIAALAAERLGRLKLNGQLVGYSPLSRVIELEALRAATEARRSLWEALGTVAEYHHVTAQRERVATDQLVVLSRHQQAAAHHAFTARRTPAQPVETDAR